MTVPTGRSAGSLHVLALSPLRAAALPLIFTVGLPMTIFPWFFGGFEKLTPGGVGMYSNPQVFLKPGDTMSVTISRLGTLTNTVA